MKIAFPAEQKEMIEGFGKVIGWVTLAMLIFSDTFTFGDFLAVNFTYIFGSIAYAVLRCTVFASKAEIAAQQRQDEEYRKNPY